MSIKVLKDILIEKGQLDCYFEGKTPVTLWRALNRKSNLGVFDFIEKGFTHFKWATTTGRCEN